jgi:ankyrin repeat protein
MNATNSQKLIEAANSGDTAEVTKLIEAGANINIQDNTGATPLFRASFNRHLDTIKVLISWGADINIQDNDGLTPIWTAIENGHTDVVKYLLLSRADINIPSNDGYTPFLVASENGDKTALWDLIEYMGGIHFLFGDLGEIINHQNDDGETALFLASQEGHVNICRDLIEIVIVDVNIPDNDDYTPLLVASENGYSDIVLALLDAGADVYAKNKSGKTALDLATDSEIIAMLKEKMEGPQEAWKGFTQSDIEKFDIIFGEGAENYSVCPICLEYVERSDACMYMKHDCSKGGGYYHNELYKKYRTSEGYISWCTICNRISKGHNHYQLGSVEEKNPVVLVLNSDPYEKDCSKTNGGGGLPEKLARFRRFREYALELQDDIDKKRKRYALNELVEEVWNAPLRREKKLLKSMAESKKWNIPSNKFTKNTLTANASASAAPNIPFTGKLPTKVEAGRNNVMMNDNIPVIQFHHTQQDGSEETHGLSEETLIDFIKTKNTEFGTPDFGYCFMYPGSCDSKLHPEEVKEYVPKELYDDYKKHFNTKFKGQIGGSNEDILHEATDAVCVIVKKGGRRSIRRARKGTRKGTRKGHKVGRKMTRRKRLLI